MEWTDEIDGNHTRELQADRRVDVIDRRDREISKIKKSGGQIVIGDRMSFNDLVTFCKKSIYKPAEIVEGRKIGGIRSLASVKIYIDALSAYFGRSTLRNITTESLSDYRSGRIQKAPPYQRKEMRTGEDCDG